MPIYEYACEKHECRQWGEVQEIMKSFSQMETPEH